MATLNFSQPRPGQPFLSLQEFVEETELFLQCATLPLRLEDFITGPRCEFSKMIKVMSVDVDLSRSRIDPPRTKPYRYLDIRGRVPQFRDFIDSLDAETKRRIEKIGYKLGD
jgi:hypothetical protein